MSGSITNIPVNPFTRKGTTSVVVNTASYTVPAGKMAEIKYINGGLSINSDVIYESQKTIPFTPDVMPNGSTLAPLLVFPGIRGERLATERYNIPYVNMFSTGLMYQPTVDFTDSPPGTDVRLAPSATYLTQGQDITPFGSNENVIFRNTIGVNIYVDAVLNVQSTDAADYIEYQHKDSNDNIINTYRIQSAGGGFSGASVNGLGIALNNVGDHSREDFFTMQPGDYLFRSDWLHNQDGVNAAGQQRGAMWWNYTIDADIIDSIWCTEGDIIESLVPTNSEYILTVYDLP